jgi:hypothetical protein
VKAADVGMVEIVDSSHPHYGERGHFTGRIIVLRFEQLAELRLENCQHGEGGCFVNKGQVAQVNKKGGVA